MDPRRSIKQLSDVATSQKYYLAVLDSSSPDCIQIEGRSVRILEEIVRIG
ncbi:hypothetical protein ACPOL_2569 [Acidisarcina polymorpha]|uniref:Uncharacterized protein n=1 Tax=Acidisarcina polymorpha TaxID=2211140 RepID=A0A2Z5FZF8_9BACT|nr:hypothetical protein ACPOL_2569 [Acidisarcina polymorpha]